MKKVEPAAELERLSERISALLVTEALEQPAGERMAFLVGCARAILEQGGDADKERAAIIHRAIFGAAGDLRLDFNEVDRLVQAYFGNGGKNDEC